ncbi:cyclic pyranopterin monophosphate synthase subunit MoaC [Erythrobacter sanguineus]|uniref:Cyclic pyranopterin monophosphate synthase n=2 Tax=Erythrobacter sanguineus TaxID=198312 RepID=A0A1M7S5X7_9SPHN|nr:cyclic pyranopterin monophosphate synthase subunit MoaC [Erythrobacter sanguineus]
MCLLHAASESIAGFNMNETDPRLTHLDDDGAARMVDVGGKPATRRRAVASGIISMSAEALAAIRAGNAPKGDVLGTARIAGIMAAKRTGELIPLCHPLGLEAVNVDFTYEDADGAGAIRATATASLTGRTGVEMEAMTAASIALLTIYDMAKVIDKGMVISEVRLIEKTGGKSGDWKASAV